MHRSLFLIMVAVWCGKGEMHEEFLFADRAVLGQKQEHFPCWAQIEPLPPTKPFKV